MDIPITQQTSTIMLCSLLMLACWDPDADGSDTDDNTPASSPVVSEDASARGVPPWLASCYRLDVIDDGRSFAHRRQLELPALIELQSRSVGFEDYRVAGLAFETAGVHSGRAAAWRTTGDSLAIQYWNRRGGATYHFLHDTAALSGIVFVWVSGESRQLRVTASPFVCVEEMKGDSATAHLYLAGPTPKIL